MDGNVDVGEGRRGGGSLSLSLSVWRSYEMKFHKLFSPLLFGKKYPPWSKDDPTISNEPFVSLAIFQRTLLAPTSCSRK